MPNEVDLALKRAREHLRNSTLEGAEAVRALLEATLHASDLTSAAPDSVVGKIQKQLEEVISVLQGNAPFSMPRAIAEPLAASIDAEIKRWERRSQTDADARLVLRAFLGMRELLWEIGMRNPEEKSHATQETSPPNPKDRQPGRKRVQRFKLED